MPVTYNGVTYNTPTVGDAVRRSTDGATGTVIDHFMGGRMVGQFTIRLDQIRSNWTGDPNTDYHWAWHTNQRASLWELVPADEGGGVQLPPASPYTTDPPTPRASLKGQQESQMPYITSEDVKAKRKELREAFPGFKLSVTKSNHSGISVAFMEGPVKMTNSPEGYEQVNHMYLHDPSYSLDPFVAVLLQKATDIASQSQRVQHVDSDYGSIPNFYINLQIGKWDKPYIVRAK